MYCFGVSVETQVLYQHAENLQTQPELKQEGETNWKKAIKEICDIERK